MTEREELKQELQEELQWVIYRQKMLSIIEEKLFEMKQIAEKARDENLSPAAIKVMNDRINALAVQIKALDSESRKNEDIRILE